MKLSSHLMWGCGAFNSLVKAAWFQLQWPESWSSVHIKAKELVPIIIAVAVWGRQWRGMWLSSADVTMQQWSRLSTRAGAKMLWLCISCAASSFFRQCSVCHCMQSTSPGRVTLKLIALPEITCPNFVNRCRQPPPSRPHFQWNFSMP